MSTPQINHRIVLQSRPVGPPTPADFRLEEAPVPVPAAGQLLLRTLYLSLDPYMRGRMSDAPSYAAPVALGEVMVGRTVSRVEASLHPHYQPGDLVVAYSGWQQFALSDGTRLTKLDDAMPRPSLALGVLGMPGFTAYMGLLDIGQPQPGETVVVAAASGAVGSAVGQIALLKGCRVVGLAGGPEKCRYVVEELGFHTCIDHQSENLKTQLAAACPQGVDVYFENVGGAVFNAVLPLLNPRARVPVCGLIAHYNDTALPPRPPRPPRHAPPPLTQLAAACPQGVDVYFENVGGAVFNAVLPLLNPRARVPVCGLIAHYNDTALPPGPDRLPLLARTLLTKRIRMQGFIIFDDYGHRYPEFATQMSAWVNAGKIKFREDVVEGLENAPSAFIGLLSGKNFGKLVVRVAPDAIS